jgi:enterochelin esterase-like enzyme
VKLVTLLAAISLVPAGSTSIGHGPAGGTLWQRVIPDPALPIALRPTVFYLPPNAVPGRRYPVVYFLHGFPGSPYQFVDGLRLAQVADSAIRSGAVPPFVAVVPPAGFDVHRGDWAGPWEDYLVRDVVPWVDANLPTLAAASERTLAGLSAGGYGAVDIGLRHPRMFGTLEAWSGYFQPLREESLAHADHTSLDAHDPSLLVRQEAPLLRRLGTRFFLSCGTTHDKETAAGTKLFSVELRSLGLAHRLWLAPGGHDGKLWRAQLPAALTYALAR